MYIMDALSSNSNNNNDTNIDMVINYGNELLQQSIKDTRLNGLNIRVDKITRGKSYHNIKSNNIRFCPSSRRIDFKNNIAIIFEYGGNNYKLSWVYYTIHDDLLFINEGCTIEKCGGQFLSVLLRILLIRLALEKELSGIVSHGWLSAEQPPKVIEIDNNTSIKIPWSTDLLTKYLDFHYFYKGIKKNGTHQPIIYNLNNTDNYYMYPDEKDKYKELELPLKTKIVKYLINSGKHFRINTVFILPKYNDKIELEEKWNNLIKTKPKLNNTINVLLGKRLFKNNNKLSECIPYDTQSSLSRRRLRYSRSRSSRSISRSSRSRSRSRSSKSRSRSSRSRSRSSRSREVSGEKILLTKNSRRIRPPYKKKV